MKILLCWPVLHLNFRWPIRDAGLVYILLQFLHEKLPSSANKDTNLYLRGNTILQVSEFVHGSEKRSVGCAKALFEKKVYLF